MMQAELIPLESSLQMEELAGESKLSHHRVEKEPFRQFTFNDSALFRESTNQLWNEIYQYPSDTSFFKKQKTCDSEEMAPERQIVPSAMEAWSAYDPEKQQIPEFPVFRSYPHAEEERKDNEDRFPRATRKGWDDLFSQPFWGTSYEKPPPFMGAFDHVQPDFGNSLNVSIPSSSQYNPYSQYLQDSSKDLKNPYETLQKLEKFDYSRLLDSKLLDSNESREKDKKEQDKHKYFFQIESVESKEKNEIQIQDFKESRIEEKQQIIDRSVVWSYEVLFGQRTMFKCVDPASQSPQQLLPLDSINNSRVFQIYKDTNSEVLQCLESRVNLSSDIGVVLTDFFILSEISKMLQNVQCQLFTLDYDTLTWKLDLLAFRPQLFLRDTLSLVLQKVLQMASYRSRLTAALAFLRKNKYRKIYSELNVQISQFLILFEEIVLELVQESTLAEFFQKSDKLECELKLLYNLLINTEYIEEEKKIYEDIDFKFLHSEALIFKRIVKLARNADGVSLDTNPLVLKLLEVAFQPLLTLLQNLLFEECEYLQLNTDLYLRYYFPNPKELLQTIGKKMSLIKQESNELYLICKVKQNFKLLHTIRDLSRYEKLWERCFKRKRKLIQRIRRQHKQKMRWQREKKIEQKMKQIFQLKTKMYKREQLEYNRKQDIHIKNRQELEKLQNQLQERKEKRKLMEQIEKERQKNILLDIQLKEKQKLARQKQKLMEKMDVQGGEGLKQSVEGKQRSILDKEGENIKGEYQIKLESKLSVESQKEKSEEVEIESQIFHKSQIHMKNNESRPHFSQIIHPIKPEEPQKAESQRILSQNAIISRQSIESVQQRYQETADAFHSLKSREKHNKSKTSSYFRIVNKPETSKIEVQALSDQSIELEKPEEQSDSESDESNKMEIEEGEEQNERIIDLQTCLSICVDEIVRKQTDIIHNCLSFIIIDKYEILQIIEFLRKTFMSGNGDRMQEFIRLSIGPGSMVGLRHFSKCLLFDTPLQQIQKLSPSFYHSKSDSRYSQISIFEDNLDYYIGFEFQSLPKILQPYFSYIHLSKYMQIFGFIVRVRHCENLISESWKLLNSVKKDLDRKTRQGEGVQYELKFMNRLCIVRHKISNFLKIFQNYLFFRVIEKQYKNFRSHLSELNDISQNHLKMLDNIIRYGFIDNPNQNISKIFKQILSYVNQFYNIVNQLALDDIPAYSWQQIQKKVVFINDTFDNQLRDIDGLLFKIN